LSGIAVFNICKILPMLIR